MEGAVAVTEEVWMKATDPNPMLNFLRDKASERKFRLFAIACCRRVLEHWTDPRSKAVIEVTEEFVEGKVGERDLAQARSQAELVYVHENIGVIRDAAMAAYTLSLNDFVSPDGTAYDKGGLPVAYGSSDLAAKAGSRSKNYHAERNVQSDHVRDIFGNPFRPLTIDPDWQTTTVTDLAWTMYDNRAFDQMPILADALEDSGCDNHEILQHCRGDVPHVKGCWVVDLILGKE